ncbi:MAG: PAS domain S-box protein [Desulfobacterales bacterium]|nr:PAS domain S-box protein [Desulfobacterales bacterium]
MMDRQSTCEELEQRIKELEGEIDKRKQATVILRDSEARMKALSDASFEAIFFSEKNVCLDQNRTAERMFGYTLTEAVGRNGTDWIIPEDRARVKNNMLSGYQKPYKVTAVRKEGTTFSCEILSRMINYQGRSIQITALRDITESKKAEKVLAEKTTLLDNILKNAQDIAIVTTDLDFRINYYNPMAEELFGYTEEEVFGKIVREINTKENINLKQFEHAVEIVRREGKYCYSVTQKTEDAPRYLESQVTGIFDSAGVMVGFSLFCRDVTKCKRAEEALLAEYTRFVIAMDSLDAGVYAADIHTHELLFVNKYIENKFGNVVGKTCWKAIQIGQTGPCTFCTNDKLLNADGKPTGPYVWEFRNTIDGEWYQCRDQAIRWLDGRFVRLESVTNITARKQAEELIRASLKEKEVLLREIHHRVKNNMQVIVSLLRMHSRKIDDARLVQVFDDCRCRVNAMALIHEALYLSNDLARIDFEVYLKKLCRNLSQMYGAYGKGIKVTVELCSVALDMDQGIALGMVISELVSNAFKHAFLPDKRGNVSVRLSCLEGKNVELIVKDDGKGLPPKIDILNTKSLGLRLAASAVTRELGGSIEVERNGGTRFVIHFKCK